MLYPGTSSHNIPKSHIQRALLGAITFSKSICVENDTNKYPGKQNIQDKGHAFETWCNSFNICIHFIFLKLEQIQMEISFT
jgi:hypothetical protein